MKILTKISKNDVEYVLIRLSKACDCEKVCNLLRKGKYSQAAILALKKAHSVHRFSKHKKGLRKADVIITGKSAHWDLS